jgi:hypothetical protein
MLEGYQSGLRGEDPRMCPYDKMTRERREWQLWHSYGVEVYIASLRADHTFDLGQTPRE